MTGRRTLTGFLGLLALFFLMGLAPGDTAPEFSLPNQDGNLVSLSGLKGKPVLLYFYPKDDTPGCTKEACQLRDNYKKFKAAGAVILGVSRQDAESHRDFRAKHKLPFDLLVDKDGKVAKAYGVGTLSGMDVFERKSALIGPDGKILKFYETVNPEVHATEVLSDIAAAKKKH